MQRVYNFAAGPAVMPAEALTTAANEMLCLRRYGHVRHGDEPPLEDVSGDL